VVATERFDQALAVARLAAFNGLNGLSLRAAREAFKGGPPVTPVDLNTGPRVIVRRSVNGEEPPDPTLQQIEPRLATLEALWRRHKAEPADVYAVLREAVLPGSRPREVFLYPAPLVGTGTAGLAAGVSATPRPRSAGAQLARWAVDAGRADDLRTRLAERQAQPMGELPALVLSALLAQAEGTPGAVVAALEALENRLRKDSLQSSAELACHAALPALDAPDRATARAAAAVVGRAARAYAGGTAEEPAGALMLTLARFEFGHGDAAAGKKWLDEYLAASDRVSARYAGESVFYRRKQSAAAVAAEFLRAGRWDDALDALGRFADAPAYRGGDPPLGNALTALARLAAARPASERFERLRAWALPASGRTSVRLLATRAAEGAPPAAFGAGPAPVPGGGVVDTATPLIAAAREAGRLDALADEVRALAGQNVENARALLVLVESARGAGAAAISAAQAVADEVARRVPPRGAPLDAATRALGAAPVWPDVLVARACLADPALEAPGKALARSLPALPPGTASMGIEGVLARDFGASRARRAAGPVWRPSHDPGLTSWSTAATPSVGVQAYRPGLLTGDEGRCLWTEHEGHVQALGGPREEWLHLAVPLAGAFTFSVDALAGDDCGARLSYGGLAFETSASAAPAGGPLPTAQVRLFGPSETFIRSTPFLRREGFNRLTVQAESGKVRFLVNGHLAYETDRAGRSTPWLALGSAPGRAVRAVYRDARLTGTPSVPRAVPLVDGDRLDGWLCAFYGESRPPSTRLMEGQPDAASAASARYAYDPYGVVGDERDWSARGGEVLGRRIDSPAMTGPGQSWLAYYRPLGDGESVAYEFWYEPGATEAHPALGRLAFLLEPGGVKLHRLTDSRDAEAFGLRPDNALDEPDRRTGLRPLPLKPDTWNAVEVRRDGTGVTLALNGEAVYGRPLEPSDDPLFGLYHDKHRTAARVRNVVIRGDWPSPPPADLLARPEPVDAASRRAEHALIGEAVLGRRAGAVLDEVGALPAAERFERLAAWVLPGAAHPGFRLQGDFAPGAGTVRAPAVALVEAAAALGRLDELSRPLDGDDPDRRGRLALRALIAVGKGDDAGAAEALKGLAGPADPLQAGWPELVAATSALGRPALAASASAVLDALADRPAVEGEAWTLQVLHARALAKGFVRTDSSDWTPVELGRASTRGQGHPAALWSVGGGAARHEPGHSVDMLYLNAPLRGDFEVRADVATVGLPVRIAYGGAWATALPGLARIEAGRLGRTPADQPLQPPLKPGEVGDWLPVRLVVQRGVSTTFVGGRKVHEGRLPSDPDPWLSVVVPASVRGAVRNLAVTGSPSVPDRLALANGSDLAGWHAADYDEPLGGTRPAWEKRGAEVYGRAFDPADAAARQALGEPVVVPNRSGATGPVEAAVGIPGSLQESVLRYHRPVREDGEIAYEFYYEPGKTMVHPALGRLAFLLEPGGVKLHRLTDGAYERSARAPYNAAVEPDCRRGPSRLPLRPKEWNRAAVALSGSQVSIRLNDVTVYERPLDPADGREFGLFHFADQTDVRVRAVTYRGDWPRSIPRDLAATTEAPRR
jgi:hypothetical protein